MADFASNPTYVAPVAEPYLGEPTKVAMTADQRANGFIPEQPIAAEHLNFELNAITADIAALLVAIQAAQALAEEQVMLANWSDGGEIVAAELRTIAWAENWGLFVVTSQGVNIFTSPNGFVWTESDDGFAGYAVAVNPSGIGVTVGEAGALQRSLDGNTWTTQTSGTSNELHGVVWTGALFVAVGGNGTIKTSPDGITWTTRTSGTTEDLLGVTRTDNYVIAAGSNGALLCSTAGVAWAVIAHPSDGYSFEASGVAWSGSICVAAGGPAAHGRISRSLARLPL